MSQEFYAQIYERCALWCDAEHCLDPEPVQDKSDSEVADTGVRATSDPNGAKS
jgi:hypothetical protein